MIATRQMFKVPPIHFTFALLFFAASLSSAKADDYADQMEKLCRVKLAAWLKAGSPGQSSRTGEALVQAAVSAGKQDLVEEVLAGGDVAKKMLPVPEGGERVTLQIVRDFPEFKTRLREEMFASFSGPEGWLARRLTANRFEIWTSSHGWLFDGKGHLLQEAHPPRGAGTGREWYGAFLPDGRWVTTDLENGDSNLTFFSASGKKLRSLSCDQLAPRPEDGGAKLLGWGRSDRDGKGWVVNVGENLGWATVWVGPEGPPRVLKTGERWDLCHPRALGPRGDYLAMAVPDDADRQGIVYEEAGHGQWVGFPTYSLVPWRSKEVTKVTQYVIPEGNYVFGFWPGAKSFFVGSEISFEDPHKGGPTRKFFDDAPTPVPVVDKTWLFNPAGKLSGWVRARRVGDSADGRSELFRMTADSRILLLGPDLSVQAMRRMVWPDGSIADAVFLWDDLRLGLFIHDHHLVLAGWNTPN